MTYRHGMQPHRSRTGVSYINDEQYIRTYVKTTDGSIHFILFCHLRCHTPCAQWLFRALARRLVIP